MVASSPEGGVREGGFGAAFDPPQATDQGDEDQHREDDVQPQHAAPGGTPPKIHGNIPRRLEFSLHLPHHTSGG
jgi:hypothetical protein